MSNIVKKIFDFYYTGFAKMPRWGIKVWLVIAVKLFIMFFILRLFFFPDLLKRDFNTDQERSDYILEQLTNKPL